MSLSNTLNEQLRKPAASLLGPVSGEMVLRIKNGSQAGRLVRLSSAKCTIGSAPDCTLRLRGRGIAPVHCLILRGAGRTIVRRWSHDTRMNDRRFDDADLRSGDRLTVGPVELQVVAVGGEERAAQIPARRLDVELATATGRLQQLTERLDLSNRQGRRRLRAVIARLRKYQLRLSELESRRAQWTQETALVRAERERVEALGCELKAQFAELDVRRAALEADERAATERATQLGKEQDRRDGNLKSMVDGLDRRRGELDRRSQNLQELAEAAARQKAQFERDAAALQAREAELIERTKQLELRAEELAAERRSWIQLRDEEASKVVTPATIEIAPTPVPPQVDETAERLRREFDIEKAEWERRNNEALELQQRREADLARRSAEAESLRAETAAQCETLKQSWAQLAAKESTLETGREELKRRRQTLEIAAGTLERRAAMLEADAAELQTRQSPTTDVADAPTDRENNRLAEIEAQAARQALEDRLRIEHLEAQLATWRDEAKLWKEQFEQLRFAEAKQETREPEAVTTFETATTDEATGETGAAVSSSPAESDVAVLENAEPEIAEAADAATPETAPVEEEATADDATPEMCDDAEAVRAAKAESAADVLRRLGMNVELDDQPAAAAADVPHAAPSLRAAQSIPKPSHHVAPPIPASAAAHHEGEESLDDYMQQLFQRLGRSRPTSETAPQAVAQPNSQAAANENEPKKPEPAAPLPMLSAGEFKARSIAAESHASLKTLRELANVSAKTAISKHQAVKQQKASKWKAITAAISLGAAVYCTVLYFLGNGMALYGIGAGVLFAALLMLQSLGLKYLARKTTRSLNDVLQKSTGK